MVDTPKSPQKPDPRFPHAQSYLEPTKPEVPPEPPKSAAEPLAFQYEVIERCFRDNRVLVPPERYETDEVQVSRALKPADEKTKEATEKRAKEIEKWRAERGGDPASRLAVHEGQLAAQQAQISALMAALASKK